MPVIQQIPIRLQVSTVSNPPVAPFDYNTGQPPEVWRAQTAAFEVGVFDANGDAVDLTNISYLQLILQSEQDSLTTIIVKQVDAADITKTIGIGPWKAGTAQNARFIFDAADLDQGLDAQNQKTFWLILRGMTTDDAPIIYGAGPLTIVLASNAIPAPATRYVSRGEQETEEADFTITPTSQVHTAIVNVIGAAREVKAILGIIGVQDGAKLSVTINLPETPGITISFRSGAGTNPEIATITTGSVLKALLSFYFNADDSSWVPEFFLLPPT